MKQQFLNDSGLTELIGYIKKYVKDEQDVKPYASLSVFPKTGEQNIIYIDTTVNASYYWDDTSNTYKALDVQTWATLNGKPSTFPPEDHNHDDRYFTETEMNSKLAGKANSSHKHKKADITDFPTSMPASDVPAWAKASTKPTYTKAEVGLGNVDNTADKDKSVKYATSAGSAGTASSVDWSGVKNPPTTYAPSAHTHGSGDITSLSADKITGVIGIDHLPAGALERCKIVTDDTARFKLTKNDIQNGDTVKVGTDANAKMYFVIDDTKLSSEAGYTIYTAGSATSVPWSGVTGKPSTFTPSSHKHTISDITNISSASVSYATSAGTANSVAWGNVSGKPSTFAPSSHEHDYFPKSGIGVPNDNLNTCYTAGIYSYNPTTTGTPSGYGHVLVTISFGNTHNDKNNWINQLAFDTDGYMYHREKVNDGGWRDWEKIINTSSLTSYAAPKSHTHTKSQITDFPSSLPASDVYSWAKASSKPSYSWGEISGKPSTFTPSSHTHNYAGSSSAGGSANWANGASYANYAIKTACNPTEDKSTNGLFMFQYNENTTICPDSAWWSVVRTQHSGYNNGYWQEMAYRFDSDIIKFRRNVNGSKSAWKTIAFTDSKVSSAGYADSAGSAGSVAWGNVSGRPSSMPASDVYSWAKASSKPSYSWSEISNKPGSFTPSAHTHTIANITNLQSTLDSKALNSNTIKGVSANGYWGLATPASNSVDWIRTTSYGLLPSQSGSARSGHSALGTSSWYFSNAYIDSINTSEIKIGQPNNSNNGGVELYGNSPYIDFHAGGTNTDYTSRIIAYSDRIEFVFA